MQGLGRRNRDSVDIWPGFVDALATLLMLIIFLLMIFVLSQFFLGQALSGRDEALERLSRQVNELAELLSLERQTSEELRGSLALLSSQMQSITRERDLLASQATDMRDSLAAAEERAERFRAMAESAEAEAEAARSEAERLALDIAALRALRDELEAEVAELGARLGEREGQLAEERRLSEEARAHAALLNQQLAALREELQRLSAALDEAERKAEEQEVQIADLGRRLNQALAGRVQELTRYRSEFFGRLREVLGDRPGIRIEGDRFVFQSEVLFATGSADLGESGKEELDQLADIIVSIIPDIPEDLDWILRVDGHTDQVPIRTARFPSNWELSQARALSVVNQLIERGIPPHRLAATGFGEYQPVVTGDSPTALARNRRIEIRLDQR